MIATFLDLFRSFSIALALVVCMPMAAPLAAQGAGGCNPNAGSGGFASDLGADEHFAESFSLPSSGALTRLTWWGTAPDEQLTYDGTNWVWAAGLASTDFEIQFWTDSAGVPGSLIYTVPTNACILRTPTGSAVPFAPGPWPAKAFPETRYELLLPTPLSLAGGTPYWVSIAGSTPGSVPWLWSFTPAGDGSAYSSTPWLASTDDFAFCPSTGPPSDPLGLPLFARVSVKRVLGPAQAPNAKWNHQTICAWLDDLNEIYLSSNLNFVLDEIVDLQDPGVPGSWFDPLVASKAAMEHAAEADPAAFKWRTDAVNVYLVNSLKDATGGDAGAICSSPPCPTDQNDIVILGPGPLHGSVGFAHELGHYFDLRHTHANHEAPECGCGGATDGDCVDDTVDDTDPQPTTTAAQHDQNFLAFALQQGYSPAQQADILANVMSYHGSGGIFPSTAVLTPGQRCRLLTALHEYRTAVLLAGPPASTASELVRLGSPPNPSALLPGSTSGPVIGGTWDPVVDHSSFVPDSIMDVLAISTTSPGAVNVPTAIGTLLCSLAPPPVLVSTAPGQPFAVPIPDDCELLGTALAAQALSAAAFALSLTNALDIVIGTL
ncbi:hypothetical protein [Engelhardtia mirabilis]|uniref:Peptidase M43 pregnancy-associated plasma-A domain-containing protein n=1 Tax=Engelhardtia mirabilis TaxID=2528011 RepID=A0A518BJL5_9BACT|nr:hypothetical protein Pla133_22230 [Planctomycetes bacterium Pla133]QDV01472.1 hypothetical protein Pla86_22230 [Planctomycetes bacterium Pla86]